MELNIAVTSLSALAQGSRLRVFKALVEAGPSGMQPSVLAAALGLPANTLSFHLKTLVTADLIHQERHGRALTYRANFERMSELLAFLSANCCGGQSCEVTASHHQST